MARTVAGGRDDFRPASIAPAGPDAGQPKRNYPVTGPWSQEDVVQWLMAHGGPGWPRWRAVSATAIAIAMRSNSEPVPGGLVTIRVIPGGFELEDKTGRG